MRLAIRAVLCASVALSLAAVACSGDDGDGDETPSASRTARATSTARPVRAEASVADPEQSPTNTPAPPASPPPGATPRPPAQPPASNSGAPPPPPPPAATQPPAPVGRVWTLAEAEALLASAPITPADLTGQWMIGMDIAQGNATAAAADPRAGASFERCGRLSGRLLTNAPVPDQVVSRYLGGEAVSFFTQMTVYSSEAGAADCAIEAAIRYQEPGQLANAFGTVFVQSAPVTVAQVPWPATGDGAISWTLAGKYDANGLQVDLKIQIVAFRKGNVTAVVGVAAAFEPPVDELAPMVKTVLARITAAQ